VCASRTGDSGWLCRAHTRRLVDQLRDIPGLLLELDVTITRGDRITTGHGVGRSAERPLAWNERASAKREDLAAVLGAWAPDVALLSGDELPRLGDGVAACAAWLADRGATLRLLDQAGAAYDELGDAVRGVRRVIDHPDDATRFYAGPCPEAVVSRETSDEPAAPCTGEVWAHIPSTTDRPALLRCRAESTHRWDTTQWLRVGQRILARQVELRRPHVDHPEGSSAPVRDHPGAAV
jgi:hypothetical protein